MAKSSKLYKKRKKREPVGKHDEYSAENTNYGDNIGNACRIVGNGIIIGKKIHIEGDFVVKVSNDAKSFGLNLLPSTYFQKHYATPQHFEDWIKGFEFDLPSIMAGREFRRKRIIDAIKNKLESQYRLLIVGEAGTSKTTHLMEVMCDYFCNGYQILYNFVDTEITNPINAVNFIEEL